MHHTQPYLPVRGKKQKRENETKNNKNLNGRLTRDLVTTNIVTKTSLLFLIEKINAHRRLRRCGTSRHAINY